MKKDSKEVIERISNIYVSDKCVQLMIEESDYALTILDGKGIKYHYKKGSDCYINSYLEDTRKNSFPYSNIPNHYEIHGLKKKKIINQLFDYDTVYIEVQDGMLQEKYVVKDNDEALVITKKLDPELISVRKLTHEETRQIYEKQQNIQLYIDGSISIYRKMPTQEETLNYYKETLLNAVEEEESHHEKVPLIKGFAKKYINSLTIEDIHPEENIIITDDLLTVYLSDNEISKVTLVNIEFLSKDVYEVQTYHYNVTKYNLDDAKQLEKNHSLKKKEPVISKWLNKNITRKDIREQKKLTLTRNKSKLYN